jgi:tape measure domain-containing protein
VAYRADIEIAVRGAQKLQAISDNLSVISQRIDKTEEKFGKFTASFKNFTDALSESRTQFNNAARGTDEYGAALKNLISAEETYNQELAERNRLLNNARAAQQSSQRVTRPSPTGFTAGQFGPQLNEAQKRLGRLKRLTKTLNEEAEAAVLSFNKIKIPTKQFGEAAKKVKFTGSLQERVNNLVRAKNARLNEQNGITQGLLGLNKAVLNAARSEAQERGESVQKQRELNAELAKSQQYSKPIGPEPAGGRRGRRTNVGRAVGAGLATVNLPGQDIAQAAQLGSFAGPKGAAIAAGIAVVAKGLNAVGRAAPEIARTEAEISKLEIALRGVLGSESEEGFRILDKAARDFNQPILEATKNFTQLSAAAKANGSSIKEIENTYRGLAAATKATGGNAEDLNGVLTAATQVISKGSVRAEELRGQIGDRLPGAFALFAEATGRSAQELEKALEQGEVDAKEFTTTFVNLLRDKYEPAAKRIGDSPAEAGARLEKALEDANRAAGPLLLALGAKFQQFAVDALEELKPLLKGINEFFRLDRKGKNARLFELEGGGQRGKGTLELLRSERTRLAGTRRGKIVETANIPGVGRFVGKVEDAFKFLKETEDRLEATAQQLRNELFPTGKGRDPLKPSTPEEDDLKGAPKAPKLPVSQTLQLQESLLQESIKQLDIDTKRRELQATELGAARIQNRALFERLPLQERLLELGRQRALEQSKFPGDAAEINQVFDAQLQNLRSQNALLREQAIKREQNLVTAREIAALEFSQQTEQITVGFERQIEDAGAFNRSEALELQISQTRRREDAERDLTAQIEKLRIAEKGGNANATAEIERLEGRRQAVLGLLDTLSQAEQQQLRFNQAFEAVSPAVNSLVGGLQEVVAGTKSAEEAFADFLNTIADQLIQTAATLIAQYIAIGLAKAFAGLGTPVGGQTSLPGTSIGSGGGEFTNIAGNVFGTLGPNFGIRQRADGGPVSANRPYIVGERGPELLIPQTSGTVLSNEDSRAALAKYSPGNNLLSETGDSTGTVAGRNETLNPVINISTGPTLQFEGEGYVKQEDFKAGLARAAQEGAKQGQTLTLRKLMMSPTARSKIGI